MTSDDTLSALRDEIRAFSTERNWGQFHLPRSLVLALVGEVGELAAELQWVPDSQVDQHLDLPARREAFEEELADVVIYALRLADVTHVDLAAAVRRKLVKNESRYPVERSRGTSRKYNQPLSSDDSTGE